MMRGRLWWTVVFSFVAVVAAAPAPASSAATSCPLNFTVLDDFPSVAAQVRGVDSLDQKCLTLSHGVDVLLSVYLKRTGYFLPPPEEAESCIQALELYFQAPNITQLCQLSAASISRGADNCQGIQTREDFLNSTQAAGVASSLYTCDNNGALADGNTKSAACAACTKALTLVANSLRGSGNGSDNLCVDYTAMYTGAEVVTAGPSDATTLLCLWGILSEEMSKGRQRQWWLYLVIGAGVIFFGASCAWVAILLVRRRRQKQSNDAFVTRTKGLLHGSMGEHGGGLTWYSIEELRAATRNFDVEMIIGQGGFGNVYKGVLPNGHEVACKRFKDCTAAGDANFLHEVQALASVRHKNLVALRGCCIASLGEGRLAGYQRIIVLDYVKNGSLQDHLFGNKDPDKPILTWPQRHKIATGTARGLEYLHSGAQVQILHRDIKPSNILLDGDFNAMVADFGLVKFTPNGMTHMTTRVAGSFGYVAPEYALYNQLTERSDVYSFGVVLLELISGHKATTPDPATSELLTDWAWRLTKESQWEEILDERLTDRGPAFEMERFVMLALLCAHPQVYYRPTMASVLRMLENAHLVPPLPDRPVPVTFSKAAFQAALSTSSSISFRSAENSV
jgi:serine/threonine protein kinase